MPLPILQTSSLASPAALVRFFHQTEVRWTQHFGEETQLRAGTAFSTPELPNVRDANRILDAALPDDVPLADAMAEVIEHYRQRGTRCWDWVMNPSAPANQTAPLIEHLQVLGYRSASKEILYLDRAPTLSIDKMSDLKIIPARASYRHARMLAEESAAEWNEPQLADAMMIHLDDPHWDCLIALRDGAAVATLGVLAMGEIGRIENVYVSAKFRRQGIGRTMMNRALEICARSLFKHVLLSCRPENSGALSLYHKLGFQKIGEIISYHAAE